MKYIFIIFFFIFIISPGLSSTVFNSGIELGYIKIINNVLVCNSSLDGACLDYSVEVFTQCSSDTDCKENEICIDDICVIRDPGDPDPGDPDPGDPDPGDPDPGDPDPGDPDPGDPDPGDPDPGDPDPGDPDPGDTDPVGSRNSIVDFEGRYLGNALEITTMCLFDTSGDFLITNILEDHIMLDCNSIKVINIVEGLNLEKGMIEMTFEIDAPCNVCKRTAYVNIYEKRENISIPDNNLILLFGVLLLVIFSIKKDRINANFL